MRVRRRGLFTLVAVGALAVSGCGATSGDGAAAPVGSDTSITTTGAGSYEFTVATLDGATFDGRSLAGKPALLWFWAPWCPTCLGQAKQVNALVAKYADKVSVVGVAGLDGVPAMHDFVRMAKLSGFPQLADEQGVVWKRFGMIAQSTFVVLDADGTVVVRGNVDVAELPKTLDQLLAG